MVGMRTILAVADNSGARKLSAILPRGGDKGLRAGLGDIVTAAVTMSPNPARSPLSPPRGRIQESLRAPLLSATSRMVRIPIMAFYFSFFLPDGFTGSGVRSRAVGSTPT